MSKVNQMWGGRFDLPPSELMQEINASLPYDRRLYAQDIRGSKAHAAMLAKQGILTSEEEKKIQSPYTIEHKNRTFLSNLFIVSIVATFVVDTLGYIVIFTAPGSNL